ncbi:MAG: galactose oxidase-like domain-containing protein [Burkholderiaceae bacterium]
MVKTSVLTSRWGALLLATLLAACGGSGGGATGSDEQSEPPVALDPDPTPPERGDKRMGAMGAPAAWPLVPIHMGLTADGRVVSFGRESADASEMVYDIWDYTQGLDETSHLTLPNVIGTDLFCANQLMLASGEMLMTGGDTREGGTSTSVGRQTGEGNADATAFDPSTNRIKRVGTMREGRWYGTMTKLTNGEIFIQGGSGVTLSERPRYTEIATPDGRQYRSLTGFDVYDLPWLYPRNFVAPDGNIIGWSKRYAYRLRPAGDGQRVDFGYAPQVRLDDGFLSVMYRPGKVLLAGGRSTRAIRADINGPIPVYESVPKLSSPRIYGTATVLPSGDVLISNGGDTDTSATDAPLGEPAYHVALYKPESNTFIRGPETQFARLYHSASILLPDATVLLGGGGLPGPVTNLNAEIYYPGYLFDANGALAERPVIEAAPDVLDPASTFSLEVSDADAVAQVVLVKTGAVTHSVDMDQRFVELVFEVGPDQQLNQLQVTLPANAAYTTPGFYHVFVLNEQGVPSISKIVRINPFAGTPPQTAPIGIESAVLGQSVPAPDALGVDSDVAQFELICGADELLVGLHGETDQRLSAIGPVCMRIDRVTGNWTGNKTPRPAAGAMMEANSPNAFETLCESGQALIGISANTGQFTESPDLVCQAVGRTGGRAPVPGDSASSQTSVCPDLTFAQGIRGVQGLENEIILGLGLRCEAS